MTNPTNKKTKNLLYVLCGLVGLLLISFVLVSDHWENPLQLISRIRKTGTRLIVTAQSINSTNNMIRQDIFLFHQNG